MEKKEKDYRVILTAVLVGSCVPIKEEMHFIQAVNKKEARERTEELVKKKNKWDSGFHWLIKQVVASNGRIIHINTLT